MIDQQKLLDSLPEDVREKVEEIFEKLRELVNSDLPDETKRETIDEVERRLEEWSREVEGREKPH